MKFLRFKRVDCGIAEQYIKCFFNGGTYKRETENLWKKKNYKVIYVIKRETKYQVCDRQTCIFLLNMLALPSTTAPSSSNTTTAPRSIKKI